MTTGPEEAIQQRAEALARKLKVGRTVKAPAAAKDAGLYADVPWAEGVQAIVDFAEALLRESAILPPREPQELLDSLHEVFTQHGIASRSDVPQALIGDIASWAARKYREAHESSVSWLRSQRDVAEERAKEWREKWINDKGIRDERIATLEADLKESATPRFASPGAEALRVLKDWAEKERDEWSERNADRYWQMNRVVAAINQAALGQAEARAPQGSDVQADLDAWAVWNRKAVPPSPGGEER